MFRIKVKFSKPWQRNMYAVLDSVPHHTLGGSLENQLPKTNTNALILDETGVTEAGGKPIKVQFLLEFPHVSSDIDMDQKLQEMYGPVRSLWRSQNARGIYIKLQETYETELS